MEASIHLFLVLTILTRCLPNGSPRSFPSDFIFGIGVSSYQTEGAWNEDGKGLSNVDYAMHSHPERITDGTSGDVACDSYHFWKRDVAMIKYLGVQTYKFSINWPRIIPDGFSNIVNPIGILYYNNLIDELLANGIEPIIVIHHMEMPISLSEIGGWSNDFIIDFFVDYALVLFENYGDRVKKWITFNEPALMCAQAPLFATQAYEYTRYYCGKNILLAHAKAYHEYQKKFYPTQKGQIGMSFETFWHKPKSLCMEDKMAAHLGWAFIFSWISYPLLSKTGGYHPAVENRLNYVSKIQNSQRSRLPQLTSSEIDEIRGTLDFIGVNYYTAFIAAAGNGSNLNSWEGDVGAQIVIDSKSNPIGLGKVLNFIKEEYDNPVVYITENGFVDPEMEDTKRIKYLKDHLNVVLQAIEDGCNVKGYIAWTLMDNWEWFQGFTTKCLFQNDTKHH